MSTRTGCGQLAPWYAAGAIVLATLVIYGLAVSPASEEAR